MRTSIPGVRPRPVLDDEALGTLAEQLKVLGNARRLGILQALVTPRYIEEIARDINAARQTAQEHVDRLVDIGVVARKRGRRDTGPVTEYVVVPQRLFALYMRFGKLGGLEPETGSGEELRRVTAPVGTGVASPRHEPVPSLFIVHGMHVGRVLPLTGDGPWLIGRDPSATACLDYDPHVSARHAEVRRTDGGLELMDLYSSNGTAVEWRVLPRGGAHALRQGDVIGVGRSLLLFKRPDP